MTAEIIEQERSAPPEWWQVMLPFEFKATLEDVAALYGYKLPDAARNALRVGSSLARENPMEFLRLLNGNA